MNPQSYAETHEVFNQVPSLDGANLYRLDLPLQFGMAGLEVRLTERQRGGTGEQRETDSGRDDGSAGASEPGVLSVRGRAGGGRHLSHVRSPIGSVA